MTALRQSMFLLSFALLTKFAASAEFWNQLGRAPFAFPHLKLVAASNKLFWVTLGNTISGMVGVAYWFIYLRNARMKSRPEH